MPPVKLTDKLIAATELPPDRAQVILWDSEIAGFGVVIGKTARTFIAEGRVDGAKCRKAFGVLGRIREDGHAWNTTLARVRVRAELGKMADDIHPNADRRASASAGGPTLRAAMELHLGDMTKDGRAERSIVTLRDEVTKYMAEWLDRPIAELTGAELKKEYERILAAARPRAGTNPLNPKGAPLANRVVTHVSVCWAALNRELEGKLGNWNPARAFKRHKIKAKRERVAGDDLPSWWATVQTLSPVRRDLQTFCMFSGMRSEAARNVRWEHVDVKARKLAVPAPKGGEEKAFDLPLGPTLVELFKRRQRDNATEFAPYGGDAGLVFPSLSRAAPFVVQPIAEAKERRANSETGVLEKILPGPHVSRRTYLSVATEAGIGELDRHVLANHAFGSRSVNASYIEQAFPHLLKCQTTIDAALWARIEPSKKKRARR